MTVDEVFEKHKELLFALMTGGGSKVMTVVNVLQIYAKEIDQLSILQHPPQVTTYVDTRLDDTMGIPTITMLIPG